MRGMFFFVLVALANALQAQSFFEAKKYPRSYFKSPVRIPLSLAGNFGECRPNHFHSGLDVRTNKVENIPIYAIGDGYISRIKIEAGGFGNAIYVTHPNGFTSLYAHLNNFFPALERHVRYNQYLQESWNIDLLLKPHEFPLRAGDFLAYSGNTGSSQAPHLHMEIRDAKTDKPLNGLLFFNMPDTKAPLLKKLAVYDANKSIYEQSAKLFTCVQKNGVYTLADTVRINSSYAACGLVADDPMEEALGVLGVYELNMYVNDAPHFGWQLDNIGYEETRYMNAMADYTLKKNKGPWVQLCYKQAGDKLNIYKHYNTHQGRIDLSNGAAQKIKLLVKDVKGNISTLVFYIKSTAATSKAAYTFMPNKENTYRDNDVSFTLPKDALYDAMQPRINAAPHAGSTYSKLYNVHNGNVPLHTYFDLKLKPTQSIPTALANKVAVVRAKQGAESNNKGKGAKVQDGWVVSSVRDFGVYTIVIDTEAPSMQCALKEGGVLVSKYIVCKATDAVTSVAKFKGTIDGKWVRFVQKGNTYTYEADGLCGSGAHVLEVTAIDENGNAAAQKINFTKNN